MSLPLALSIAVLLSAAAWRLGTLTLGGAFAAGLVGATILMTAGWPGAGVLATFFLSSLLMARLLLESGDRETRTARQVLANGGAAALGGLLALSSPTLGGWIVTASLAAAAGDTWATTLGRRSSAQPVLLGTRQRVPPGTSGGVTFLGTVGAALGALLVAAVGGIALGSSLLVGAGFLIGVGGMFLDSLLGARYQGRFECPTCRVPTERRRHECGCATISRSGWAWLDNDGVNLLTTMLAGAAGAVAWALR